MDISSFDFGLDEVIDLLSGLPGLAKIIEIEPRLHWAEETDAAGDTIHSGAEPTFRIKCELAGGDKVIGRLEAFESQAAVEVVLDHDSTVRLRHMSWEQSGSEGNDEDVT